MALGIYNALWGKAFLCSFGDSKAEQAAMGVETCTTKSALYVLLGL